jgi:hypothetical protein
VIVKTEIIYMSNLNGATTLSIMSLTIMTLGIMGLFTILSMINTEHK